MRSDADNSTSRELNFHFLDYGSDLLCAAFGLSFIGQGGGHLLTANAISGPLASLTAGTDAAGSIGNKDEAREGVAQCALRPS